VSLVAEQFIGEQVFGEGRYQNGHEGTVPARTPAVKSPGRKLFSGSAFAGLSGLYALETSPTGGTPVPRTDDLVARLARGAREVAGGKRAKRHEESA